MSARVRFITGLIASRSEYFENVHATIAYFLARMCFVACLDFKIELFSWYIVAAMKLKSFGYWKEGAFRAFLLSILDCCNILEAHRIT
jgi:hypothetical protein